MYGNLYSFGNILTTGYVSTPRLIADTMESAPASLTGGTDYASATRITKLVSNCGTGQIENKWFKFPSANAYPGRIIVVISTAQSYGAVLVSDSGSFMYKDGTASVYNNTNPPQTPSSIWVSNGTDWYQVG